MSVINLIISLTFGLIIGSFLNVLIYRIDDLRSVFTGRSHCRHCRSTILWYDLIPVLSYVLLKGRCRFCDEKISYQYPIVEIVTGIIFMLIYLYFGITLEAVYYAIIFSILLVVAVYDIRTQYVPEAFVWTALILSVFSGFLPVNHDLLSSLLGGVIGSAALAIFVIVSKERWMGAGDIKIGAILGLLTGFPKCILALFLSFVLGSIFGLIYIAVTKKGLKSALPFAPFLILATLIAIFWGNPILNWYLGKVFY